MLKSTAFWVILLAVLAAGTGLVLWSVFHHTPREVLPLSAVAFGLPGGGGTQRSLVEAESAIVWDTTAQRILLEQKAFDRHPIASLTKVMTAMVALDAGVDMDQRANINMNEYGPGGNLVLAAGEEVTMKDLLAASLLGSANNATKAYVRQMGISDEEFTLRMNRKAVELGLEQTSFTDITGLDSGNISNAYEVARMMETAFKQYPQIAELTSRQEYSFSILNSNREHSIRNTNKLVAEQGVHVTGSKTGYLDEARYCLAVQGAEAAQNRVVVVLGSPSQESNEGAVARLLQGGL